MLHILAAEPGTATQQAQAAASAAANAAAQLTTVPSNFAEWLRQPWILPQQADLLTWCQNMNPAAACMMIICGVIYLMFGFYAFKWLVTLNALLIGAYIGTLVGKTGDAAVAGAFMGGFAAAAATWPLMKWAVAVMGGLFGALAGVTVWRTCGLDPAYAWSGGLTGLVFFGMLNFVVFKVSIMTYTSLQGSVMLIFGALSLVYKYPEVAQRVTEAMTFKPFILPAAVFVPTVIGMFYQSQGTEPEVKKK